MAKQIFCPATGSILFSQKGCVPSFPSCSPSTLHIIDTKEVWIIRTSAPVKIKVYHPKTKEGQQDLANKAAEVHADYINWKLKQLNSPNRQKLELLDAIKETIKHK